MKTKINFAIFIILCSVGYFPIVSYATDYSLAVEPLTIDSISDIGSSRAIFVNGRDDGKAVFYRCSNYSRAQDISGGVFPDTPLTFTGGQKQCLFSIYSSGFRLLRLAYYDSRYPNSVQTITSGNLGFTGICINGGLNSDNKPYYTSFYETDLPIFDVGVYNTSELNNADNPVYDYLVNGNLRDTLNVIDYGYSDGSDDNTLGHIIQTGYKYNPSKIFNEIVTWDKTKSSTGYQYQSFDMVQFYAMDRSTKTLKNDIGALGGVSELVDWAERQLEKFVYPKGSNDYLIASGQSGKSGSYGKMIKIIGVEADTGKAEFGVLNSMQNNSYDTDFQNYVRTQIGSTDKRTWYDKYYQWFTGNTYVYDVCYDIYCVIEDVNGNQGTWYKINFHDTPLQERGNRLKGGVTITPVEPDSPIDTTSTDWQDVNFTEIYEGDTITDNSDNSISTYITNNEGDDYYITNNYIYNYDNRSWTENVYNNQDTGDVSDAMGAIPIIGAFFGLFLMFFGAFLPASIISLISIVTPLLLGVFVFRVVKTIIPFV